MPTVVKFATGKLVGGVVVEAYCSAVPEPEFACVQERMFPTAS